MCVFKSPHACAAATHQQVAPGHRGKEGPSEGVLLPSSPSPLLYTQGRTMYKLRQLELRLLTCRDSQVTGGGGGGGGGGRKSTRLNSSYRL